MSMMDGWPMMGGLMLLVPLVLLGVLIAGVVLLAQAVSGGRREQPETGQGPSHALAILEERYARGEIDHDEFEQRRRRLTGEH